MWIGWENMYVSMQLELIVAYCCPFYSRGTITIGQYTSPPRNNESSEINFRNAIQKHLTLMQLWCMCMFYLDGYSSLFHTTDLGDDAKLNKSSFPSTCELIDWSITQAKCKCTCNLCPPFISELRRALNHIIHINSINDNSVGSGLVRTQQTRVGTIFIKYGVTPGAMSWTIQLLLITTVAFILELFYERVQSFVSLGLHMME